MPNYVRNVITLNGPEEDVKKLIKAIMPDTEGAEIGEVDFNKIIPQPKDIYQGPLGPKEKEKYGDKNWHTWRLANWGTKWNACNCKTYEDIDSVIDIEFDTAWSVPMPIIEKLAAMFPKVDITCRWADDDTGNNTGYVEIIDGELYESEIESGSKEAYENYFEVHKTDCESVGLIYNEEEDNYEWADDEDIDFDIEATK